MQSFIDSWIFYCSPEGKIDVKWKRARANGNTPQINWKLTVSLSPPPYLICQCPYRKLANFTMDLNTHLAQHAEHATASGKLLSHPLRWASRIVSVTWADIAAGVSSPAFWLGNQCGWSFLFPFQIAHKISLVTFPNQNILGRRFEETVLQIHVDE